MSLKYQIRPARDKDARQIAELVAISSGGIATIEWQEQAGLENCEPLDVGERIYRIPQPGFSYLSTIIVELDGDIAGMLLTFAIPDSNPRNSDHRPDVDQENVFAPYIYLEEPNSWYICGVAFYPQHRGKGLGSKLMSLANQQAIDNGFKTLSLIAFEENPGSVRLYQRLGYKIVDHAPIVPHHLIPYHGDAYLMTRAVI
jgi:ribosomal protein S18 acetylase RimI-like enzyme